MDERATMRTELKRDVAVVRYATFAEMAWLEIRPELGAICALARDDGRRITPAVVEQALPGVGEVGSANLVRSCALLGLCDPSGALLRLGEDAAETNEAHVPEQGVYEFWAARDLLLGLRALHVERVAPSSEGAFSDVKTLPLLPDRDRLFTSVSDGFTRFLVRSFPSNQGRAEGIRRATSARCEIRWALDWEDDRTSFTLVGTIDAVTETRPIQHVPERVELDLWALMESWSMGPLRQHGRWVTDERRLLVTFETVAGAPGQQDSFTRDIELGEVEVPRFGPWTGGRLTDVPIGPANPAAARAWARSRLDQRVRADDLHRTRADVRRLFVELTEGTPLAPFAPTLPGHEELLGSYVREPEVFWRLACAVDLGPYPTPPAELASLEVGASELAEPPAITDEGKLFLVPYRARSSMRDLVTRLTARQRVGHVLLVDPFVRGQENLVSLALLHEALAERGCASLDVWTGTACDGEDLQAIERVTGCQPRQIGDVIGRHGRLPHDRYIVVVADSGPPFGWQLSNSPLDARAPGVAEPSIGTVLQWRDMLAGRLSVEQLHREMRTWAERGTT